MAQIALLMLQRQLALLCQLPFPMRLSRVDVQPLLTNLCTLYQQAHDIHITCSPPLHPVVANPLFLTEVFDHILSNAVKFSQPDPQITIRSRQVDGFVQYAITDHGRGISPEQLEHVFKWGVHLGSPFGFGIGLSVARNLMRRMNGDIWIESRIGTGTTVYIQLRTSVAKIAPL